MENNFLDLFFFPEFVLSSGTIIILLIGIFLNYIENKIQSLKN